MLAFADSQTGDTARQVQGHHPQQQGKERPAVDREGSLVQAVASQGARTGKSKGKFCIFYLIHYPIMPCLFTVTISYYA